MKFENFRANIKNICVSFLTKGYAYFGGTYGLQLQDWSSLGDRVCKFLWKRTFSQTMSYSTRVYTVSVHPTAGCLVMLGEAISCYTIEFGYRNSKWRTFLTLREGAPVWPWRLLNNGTKKTASIKIPLGWQHCQVVQANQQF